MPVLQVSPDPSIAPLLAAAQFADAYRLAVDEPALDAVAAAQRIFARTPKWISRLLALRNLLVAPLGLKGTGDSQGGATPARIGFFPVVSQTPDRVVLGFDDKHLDFRVIVDVSTPELGVRSVTATTLVRQNNRFGRLYLAIVLPFHRVIAPAMLAQASRS